MSTPEHAEECVHRIRTLDVEDAWIAVSQALRDPAVRLFVARTCVGELLDRTGGQHARAAIGVIVGSLSESDSGVRESLIETLVQRTDTEGTFIGFRWDPDQNQDDLNSVILSRSEVARLLSREGVFAGGQVYGQASD